MTANEIFEARAATYAAADRLAAARLDGLTTDALPELPHHGPGWERIGALCSVGRRSMWMRLTNINDPRPLPDGTLVQFDDPDNVERIELRAGREGDDSSVVIERGNPQFAEILAVLLDARFAAQT